MKPLLLFLLFLATLACGGGGGGGSNLEPINGLNLTSYRPSVGTIDQYVINEKITASNNLLIERTKNEKYSYFNQSTFPNEIENSFPNLNYYRIKYRDNDWVSTNYYDNDLSLLSTETENGIKENSNQIISTNIQNIISTGESYILFTSDDIFDNIGGNYLYTAQVNLIYQVGYLENINSNDNIINTFYYNIYGTLSSNRSGNNIITTLNDKVNYEIDSGRLIKSEANYNYTINNIEYNIENDKLLE